METEGFQPLDPRFLSYQRLTNWIAVAVTGAASFIGLISLIVGGDFPRFVSILLVLLWVTGIGALGPLLQRYAAAAYRQTSYRVDGNGLEIRRGVLWRSHINVPRTRVQHTDVSQGPLERLYGLGTLVVFTAGTDHARVSLDGLAHDTAMTLRSQLLPSPRMASNVLADAVAAPDSIAPPDDAV